MASVVSNTTRPETGEAIAFFCVVVITGNRTPCVTDETSSAADDDGARVPMPMLPELVITIRARPEVVPVVNEMAVGTVPAETAPSTNEVIAPSDMFDVPSDPINPIVPSESFICTAVEDVAVVPRVFTKRWEGPAAVFE